MSTQNSPERSTGHDQDAQSGPVESPGLSLGDAPDDTAGSPGQGDALARNLAAGGSGREYAILAILTGALGVLAAIELMLDYLRVVADPNYVPACDLNPLIGCGMFLGSWQSSAFGIPNTVIGMVAFPVVLTTGVLLLGRVRLPRWYWRGLLAGATFGIGFVTWLQYQAITQIGALCPYCMVVWLVVIPFFVHTLARSMQNGALPVPGGLRDFVVPNRWLLTVIWYLAVVAAAAFGLGEAWLLVL